MPLPSQSARPISRRSHMHSRKRGRWLRPIVVLAVVAGLVLIGRVLWPSGPKDPTDTVAKTNVPNTSTPRGSSPVTDRETATPADGRGSAALARPETALPKPPPAAAPETTETPAPRIAATPDPVASLSKPPDRASEQPTPAPAEPETARPAATTPPPSVRDSALASQRLAVAKDLIARNQPVKARRRLSDLLASGDLTMEGVTTTRALLTEVNDRLVFSPEIVPGDPFSLAYTVQPNDALSRVPRKMGVQVNWRFIQRINRILDPKRIRPGQRLKLVTGPFHAVVSKHDFRLDLYLGEGSAQVYVRSFPVGLGEYGSTPTGRFIVRPDSKLENPEWINPRTGERFLPDDPKNPIGDYWLGLMGDEPHLASVVGYGIHGTIEPESIGRESSMGCVRMRSEDIALVWSVLKSGVSVVEIRP